MDISTIRSQIPALSRATYLNTGTFGPSPSLVIDEIRRALDLVEMHGAYSPIVRQRVEQDSYEETRSVVAAFLGATPDEIVLTRNVSDGINTVAYGLNWRQGDEVVISDQEHHSGILPWFTLSQRFGVRVKIVSLASDPDLILARFNKLITARTRLVFASHISCISGLRLPVGQICRLAHQKGALAVVDGAHALGQFPVNVRQIGCDAYLACGHKWLLGPQGTSMAYIAREHLETFRPSWIGWGAHDEFSVDLAAQTFALSDSARRFEFGTKQWPLFPGLTRAIQFIDQVGLPAIQTRVQPLATRLKQALDAIPHLQRLTPLEASLSSGIVSLTFNNNINNISENVKDILWNQQRLIVAYDPASRRLRLSVAFFTTQDEIDRALAAIETLARRID